ncbi:MAG: aspartate kinase [Muribaculaceae bacterium]|nr:aspartate kinase [Muribaculaceae bacterium]
MKVLKFGGTSVGSAARIEHVADLVAHAPAGSIVVLSAMSGTTNTLVEIAEYLYKGNIPGAQETINALTERYDAVLTELFGADVNTHPEPRAAVARSLALLRSYCRGALTVQGEKEILAQGELMSTAIMLEVLRRRGIAAAMLPALDYMRITADGEPDMESTATALRRLIELEPQAQLFLTQGYICRNHAGAIDNLRRGGSDYSASIIGALADAEEIQIWTDIDGMHNNDPRYVEGTRPVRMLHFEEAAELAYFGAKILHPACVLPAKLHNIPVRLLNTLEPQAPGTLICNCPSDGTVKAIAAKDGITLVNIKSGRMLLAYGFLHKVFETFENHRTSIDIMATSEVAVSVTIDDDSRLAAIVDDLMEFGTVSVDRNKVIVCIVGDLSHSDDDSRLGGIMRALADIPVRMISYGASERSVAILVDADDKLRTLKALSAHLFNEA